MDTETLINAMTPQIYERMQYAVETGKWPEGIPLTQEQRDSCMQAIMLYQSKHNNNAEHMSIAVGGEIKFKSKAELKSEFFKDRGDEESGDIVRVNVNK